MIQQQLIGLWRLVYSVEVNEKNQLSYPFGEDALGYIFYSASGHMAVQICRRQDENFKASELKKLLPRTLSSYLAYFGRYEIDEQQEIVKHILEGSLLPERIGRILERKYHFYDNKLSLKPWDGTHREILWEKIS